MLTKAQVALAANELAEFNVPLKAKYLINMRRYYYNPYLGWNNINQNNYGFDGYQYSQEFDTTEDPSLNVIKSVIDTLVSKLSSMKARPFFNGMNTNFSDIRVIEQAQNFFDVYFDEQKVDIKVSEAFRDACIFHNGWIHINPEDKTINKISPWEISIRPSEKHYGNITRCLYTREFYPVCLLPEKYQKKFSDREYVTYSIYYDTTNKTKAYIIEKEIQDIEKYEKEILPFIPIYYVNPTIGNTAQSVVDILKSLQIEIDVLMSKIKDASQLNPALTFFVPEGSSIKSAQLSNRMGNVVQYKRGPNDTGGSPITVATPSMIDDQYLLLLDNLIQKAYEMVGISQLSATSKKPQDVETGVAFNTLENIESERFQTQVNNLIKMYVDIAKACIKLFPADEKILPADEDRVDLHWKDIKDVSDKMKIQYSAADSLSKDPSTKLQQLTQLAQAGIIPQSRIASLMELPDIQNGYNLANNALRAVQCVIEDCIKDGNYEIPDYIPYQLLKEEIVNVQLSLKASRNPDNQADIDKLTKLYDKVIELEGELQQPEMNPQMEAQGIADMQTADLDMETDEGSENNGSWNGGYTTANDANLIGQ